MKELCNKCKSELLHIKPGAGESVEICQTCDIAAAFDYIQSAEVVSPWKTGVPEVKGRYFVLVDFDNPVMSGELSIVRRTAWPMVSNYTPEKGWLGELPEMKITHWMEVPELKKFKFVQIDPLNPPKPPDSLFKIDDDGVTLKWGGSDYFIEWKRLATKEDLLRWICHIGEKEWELMTPYRVAKFIHAVYRKHGWDMYPNAHQ